MKFENHYKIAIKEKTHYMPDGAFIINNCKHEFNEVGCLKSLTLKIDIFFVFYGRKVAVKKGFKFDGVSTGIFKLFFPKFSLKTLAAGLLHDWFYSKFYQINRHLADVYLEMVLIFSKVSIIKSKAFYIAVRLFGWLPWRNNKKLLINKNKNEK